MTPNEIIILILLAALTVGCAFGAAYTAGKKGYNKAFFFVYGLFAQYYALIHSSIMPDRMNNNIKAYNKKAITFSALAVSAFVWNTRIFINSDYLTEGGFYLFGEMLLSLFLIISIMLGRHYRFSIGVYAAFIVLNLLFLLSYIPVIKSDNESEYYHLISKIFEGSSFLLIMIAFAVLLYIAIRYGTKFSANNGIRKFTPVFILPSVFIFLRSAMSFLIDYWGFAYGTALVKDACEIVVSTAAFLFLGLFYYEDAKYKL